MSVNTKLITAYTAAEAIPVKFCTHEMLTRLRPIHVQWMPTNRCNLQCRICSCSNRDTKLEMDIETAADVIRRLAHLGCTAVTITGGGEPLCHPHLSHMLQQFHDHGIAIGLVTNGLLLDRLSEKSIRLLTWCRISHGDERPFARSYEQLLTSVMHSDVDWAFSYVAGSTPDFSTIRRLVEFGNEQGVTHIRIVSDILHADESDMASIKHELDGIDSRVIYQNRRNPEAGGRCWIAYIKPVILPDWTIGPCCGYQYALEPPTRDLPESMKIGDAREIERLYSRPRPLSFGCVRCYYVGYNRVLDTLFTNINHPEFI